MTRRPAPEELAELLAVPPRGLYAKSAKPLLDRLGAVVLLLALIPLLSVITLAVALSLGRPIFFRQQRIGLHGRPFGMWKFRTMHPDRRQERRPGFDGADRRRTHKTPHDPRHTTVGRFLRKWSLDELPQLWNVVCGDMSIVGPRPELAQIVERYEPWQHRRHLVKPGVTGLWQVTKRGQGHMYEHTALDLEYIWRFSPRTDLRIILLTVPVLLGLRTGD